MAYAIPRQSNNSSRRSPEARAPPGIVEGSRDPPRPANQQLQQPQQQRFPAPGHAQQKMTMPPPQSIQKLAYSQAQVQHRLQQGQCQGAYPPGMSRSVPGLPGGQGLQQTHLKETSRDNIRSSMPRQPSATMGQKDSAKMAKDWQKAETVRGSERRDDVELQFDHLLDSLQVPSAVRDKFATVSRDVKNSILASTATSNPAILASLGLPIPPPGSPKAKKKLSAPLLRKTKSSGELKGGQAQTGVGGTYTVGREGFIIVASPQMGKGSSGTMPSPGLPPDMHQRGQSLDISVSRSPDPTPSPRPSSRLFAPSSMSKSATKGLGIAMGGAGEQPAAFLQWLASSKGTDLTMDVSRCKKLRMLLRHESTDWVGAFLEGGGYTLVLDRLQDLLDIEWREEQHDDQMLYELLRCIKALSTSEIGKVALRRSFPRPFPELSKLLFSEKKPGDLASRQVIVELWIFLFNLFPPSSPTRPTSIRFDGNSPTQVELTQFIRGLLVPDLPDPTKEQHEFVTQAHRPRVFKAWVGELSDICRDYFWIMCHGSNTLWALDQVDARLVERPVAPGGATGGVEFEAMNYVTNHFKLLNAYAKRQAEEDKEKALQLHYDLMASGMDRILVTFRKASTTYYPSVHLELARYIAILQQASPTGKLPYLISKMVGPPPSEVRKLGIRGADWLSMSTDEGREKTK